jgi:hypothetical protein
MTDGADTGNDLDGSVGGAEGGDRALESGDSHFPEVRTPSFPRYIVQETFRIMRAPTRFGWKTRGQFHFPSIKAMLTEERLWSRRGYRRPWRN